MNTACLWQGTGVGAVNSFDQWGVELGKTLATDLLGRMASCDVAGLGYFVRRGCWGGLGVAEGADKRQCGLFVGPGLVVEFLIE